MWEDVGQLHIRKELTALRRARWLKDPSTCSSLKSPKNCIVPHGDGIAGATYATTEYQVKGILHNWTGQDLGNGDRVSKKHQYATNRDYSTHGISQEEHEEGDGDGGLDCNSRSVSPLLTKDAHKSRHQNGNGRHKKRSQILKHAMESYTPTSTRSSSRNGDRKQRSVVGSWDGTALSGEEEVDGMDLPSQGCGIPCYWSRTPKHRGGGLECGTFSPTLSDSIKRKGGNGVSRRQKESQSLSNYDYRMNGQLGEAGYSAEGLPLLTDGASSADGEGTSDGYSTYDMEAACKLERWRKSIDRSREHAHLTLTHGSGELAIYGDRHRSLSQKYRPKSFEELVGQNMVVQTLVSAIVRGKIAPVYLFQGPRGTGKTSTARIFAAALNCLSPENLRPCGFCRECIDFASSRSVDVREVDATNSNGMEKVKALLKNVALPPSFSRFKVFIIDECHMLAFETWAALLKILEEPPGHVVFILITTDSDKLPRTALSRCQKYLFPKIKDAEVVTRLQKLAIQENLEVDSDALNMIAAKSEGSLRDAETMLDQLSLLGQRITLSLVHELVGVVSDEKLLDLLELALSADTARTVRRTRELIDSGIEPMTLMSQLATLIMDILAGSYKFGNTKCKGIFFHRHALTEEELERLRRALKILSEAEKQLRVSNDQTTWLTAALLQFGSGRSLLVPTSAGTSATQSPAAIKERNNYGLLYSGSSSRQLLNNKKLFEPSQELSDSMAMQKPGVGNGNGSLNQGHIVLFNESNKGIPVSKIKAQVHSVSCSPGLGHSGRSFSDGINDNNDSAQPQLSCISPSKLDELWRRTIEECHSNTLRQLLCKQGKLLSVSMGKGFAVVQLEFWNPDTKSMAERYVKSIASSVSLILGCDVEIRINLASVTTQVENTKARKNSIELAKSSANEHKDATIDSIADQDLESIALNSDQRIGCGETCTEAHSAISRTRSFPATSEGYHKGLLMPADCAQAHALRTITTGENSGPDGHGGIEEDLNIGNGSVTDEQRLESAWLQAVEKCAPGLKDILKPEKNQVLPRDVIDFQNEFASSEGIGTVPLGVALQQKEGRSRHEMRTVKSNGGIDFRKLRCARTDHQECLCSSSFDQGAFVASFEEENLAYGSDSNSSGILCWKALKYDQEKQRRRPRRRAGLLFWVVPCAKAKRGHHIQ